MRDGDQGHHAVPPARRLPESGGDRCRPGGERPASPAHHHRGDRQPGQRRGGAGGAEHECDAGPPGNGGARVLKVRVVKIGGNELDRPEWVSACAKALAAGGPTVVVRSEEHTSELQSHVNLVCRLLLEKKKQRYPTKPQSQS